MAGDIIPIVFEGRNGSGSAVAQSVTLGTFSGDILNVTRLMSGSTVSVADVTGSFDPYLTSTGLINQRSESDLSGKLYLALVRTGGATQLAAL